MGKPMMQCGHAANAKDNQGNPCCVICAGINPGAKTIATDLPDLDGRKAKCGYGCGSTRDSSTDLAFFEHRPDRECDKYYCGCQGWN